MPSETRPLRRATAPHARCWSELKRGLPTRLSSLPRITLAGRPGDTQRTHVAYANPPRLSTLLHRGFAVTDEARQSFGRFLRDLRSRAGLTQAELAERAGVSARGIQDLERGIRRNPHQDTVRRIALGLGLEDIS